MNRESYPARLPDGVKLVKDRTFWPEGSWYFVHEGAVPLVWSHIVGWVDYFDAHRTGCHFQSAEAAIEAWKISHHLRAEFEAKSN